MRSGLRKRMGETVVVQLDNTAIRGVLVGVYNDSLELADPAELGEAGSVTLDGRAMIPRNRVSYIQFGFTATA